MINKMNSVVIVGTGFVADFYMRSQELHPDVEIIGAYDIRPDRLAEFCNYWKIQKFDSLEALLDRLPENGLVLNLTTPSAHYQVTRDCLLAGRHVYSEKPLATDLNHAEELVDLAQSRGLQLGGAPCSYLSEAAMTLAEAVQEDVCGPVRLIYAEMDDGFIPQAPHDKWFSESGAPWPYEDEMRTGCTLEHAGYVLTWMIAIFGSIRSITAFSAPTIDKGLDPACHTPDMSVGILRFDSGPILRLTITVVAPHNHELLVTGDKGILQMKDTWNNYAKLLYRRRFQIRRRLLESPLPKRLRFGRRQSGARASRRGSSTMDYFLGPVELFHSISRGDLDTRATELALHTTEATLALQNAGEEGAVYHMQSRCDPLPILDQKGITS